MSSWWPAMQALGRRARELFSLPHHRPRELARKQVACVACRKSRFCVWKTDQSQCALLQACLGWFISPSVIGETRVSDAFLSNKRFLSKVAGVEFEVVVWRRENPSCFAKLGRNSDISLVLPVSKLPEILFMVGLVEFLPKVKRIDEQIYPRSKAIQSREVCS